MPIQSTALQRCMTTTSRRAETVALLFVEHVCFRYRLQLQGVSLPVFSCPAYRSGTAERAWLDKGLIACSFVFRPGYYVITLRDDWVLEGQEARTVLENDSGRPRGQAGVM